MKQVFYLLFYSFFTLTYTEPCFAGKGDMEEKNLVAAINAHPAEDTVRINLILKLNDYLSSNPQDENFHFMLEAYTLSGRLHYRAGLVHLGPFIATLYKKRGEYDKGLEHIASAIHTIDSMQVDSPLVKLYDLRGLLYDLKADFPAALHAYQQGLKLAEKTGDKNDEALLLSNIGISYRAQKNYELALEFFERAGKIWESIDSKTGQASAYNNMATVYSKQENFFKAQEYLNKAIALRQEMGDRSGVSVCYGNLGNMYYTMKDYRKAIEYYNRAAVIQREIKAHYLLVSTLLNMANAYNKLKKYADALPVYYEGINIAKQLGLSDMEMEGYKSLSDFYSEQKEFEKALEFHKEYMHMKDSIFSEKNAKHLNEMRTKYESEKKEQEIKLLNKENDLKQNEISHQKFINYAVIAGLLLLALFSLLVFRSYTQKKKANLLLEQQKKEIALQKELVDEKNKEILDSIHYAQRIQAAILPTPDDVQKIIPGSFVLFKPKDIVSGDFYWIMEKDSYIFYTVADCTGHGVPGGFMSMLGTALLNEVINEKEILEPADVLDMLRVQIILALKQKGVSGENKDGMDMCLVRLNKDKNELVYAAANNSLYLVRNGTITEHKADKQPVGIAGQEAKQFTQHRILLQPRDCIYTFTDGYADQFGGPRGKKFKYRQLEELLNKNSVLEMKTQKEELDERFTAWKGNLAQVDDVCVMGVRI